MSKRFKAAQVGKYMILAKDDASWIEELDIIKVVDRDTFRTWDSQACNWFGPLSVKDLLDCNDNLNEIEAEFVDLAGLIAYVRYAVKEWDEEDQEYTYAELAKLI